MFGFMDFVTGNVMMTDVKVKFVQNRKGEPKRVLQEESKAKHPLMGPKSPGGQI